LGWYAPFEQGGAIVMRVGIVHHSGRLALHVLIKASGWT
jgi:hypothetical protein